MLLTTPTSFTNQSWTASAKAQLENSTPKASSANLTALIRLKYRAVISKSLRTRKTGPKWRGAEGSSAQKWRVREVFYALKWKVLARTPRWKEAVLARWRCTQGLMVCTSYRLQTSTQPRKPTYPHLLVEATGGEAASCHGASDKGLHQVSHNPKAMEYPQTPMGPIEEAPPASGLLAGLEGLPKASHPRTSPHPQAGALDLECATGATS